MLKKRCKVTIFYRMMMIRASELGHSPVLKKRHHDFGVMRGEKKNGRDKRTLGENPY